jgi:hypothetical protein
MKDMQADFVKQIELRDQEIAQLSEQLTNLQSTEAQDAKYEQRLALVKKIHEEQMRALKDQIMQRELELEETIS